MAITKLLKIKASKRGKPSAGLKQCLKYIANPDKTEDLLLIGGSDGGDPELTLEDMLANKRSWKKEGGTQGYHYILSLPPEEHPDKEIMRQLTEDFCAELLQGKYLHAYAIHTDRGHLHSHIVFDSVTLDDGKMWVSGRYDWLARVQPITDKLCKKYGLRELGFDLQNRTESQNCYHTEWEQGHDKNPVPQKEVLWNDIIRSDIDQALAKTTTWEAFLQELHRRQYEIKDRTHLSIRPKEKTRFVRTGRLGASYTKEALLTRLGEHLRPSRPFGDAEPLLDALRQYMEKAGVQKLPEIKVIYFQRWYAYSYINRSRTPWKYRADVAELGKYTDRCSYLFQHDITTSEDLQTHLWQLQEKQVAVKRELTRINNQIYSTPMSAWKKLEKLRAEEQSVAEVEKPGIQKQITAIVERLKNTDIMAETAKYHELQVRKGQFQQTLRQLKAESAMTKDLITDLARTRDRDDIMQDLNRFVPEPFTSRSWQRVTINRVLFEDMAPDKNHYLVKIPGQDRFVFLYKNDAQFAADGSYVSVYIYDHLSYAVVDRDRQFIRDIPGTEIKGLFADRTKERREGYGR